MLAVTEVDEESEHERQVRPEEDAVKNDQRLAAGAERPEDARERRRDRPPLTERLGRTFGDAGRVVELHADEEHADPRQDEDGVAAVASAKSRRVDHQAVEQRQGDPADDHEEEEVLQECDRAAAGELVELESLPERFDDPLSDRGEQHDEAPEDEGVEHAGETAT